MRREDVVIGLVPVNADDWSFGNGEASLVGIDMAGIVEEVGSGGHPMSARR